MVVIAVHARGFPPSQILPSALCIQAAKDARDEEMSAKMQMHRRKGKFARTTGFREHQTRAGRPWYGVRIRTTGV